MRKSPIKHHVRSYTRKKKKTHVSDYDRGHGERAKKLAKPTLNQKKKQSFSDYRVKIIYNNARAETFTVTAKSYPKAIENAMIIRANITPPHVLEVIRSK